MHCTIISNWREKIFVDECSSTVLKPRDVVSYQAKPLKHRDYDQKYSKFLYAHDIRPAETVQIQFDTLTNAVVKGGEYSVSRSC